MNEESFSSSTMGTRNFPSLKTIGVSPPDAYIKHSRFFSAISGLEPIRFEALQDSDLSRAIVDAVILIRDSMPDLDSYSHNAPPVLVWISSGNQIVTRTGIVEFGSSRHLVSLLREKQFPNSKSKGELVDLSPDAEVLASIDKTPIWARHSINGCTVDFIASPVPHLTDEQPYLYPHSQPSDFMGLVPLIHFVRTQVRIDSANMVPLRACFMFDDPNLHWSSFGFVDYRLLLDSAKRFEYHASFATIPCDGWYVHGPAARLFRENGKWISFLIHGNNHIRNELARGYSEHEGMSLAAQARRRINKVEQKAGIQISPVMAAPHGACSIAMAEALLRTGYSAACISRGSLMFHNPTECWSSTVGMQPAEMLSFGFPIIPRFALKRDSQQQVILSAFLEHPIIFVGHHNDLSEGYGILEEIASFINTLGPVIWLDMEAITRANYIIRTNGEILEITLYSRHVALKIPLGITHLRIRRTWLKCGNPLQEVLVVRIDGQELSFIADEYSILVQVSPNAEVEILSPVRNLVDYQQVPKPPSNFWGLMRRLLAETRDRVLPWTNWLRRS